MRHGTDSLIEKIKMQNNTESELMCYKNLNQQLTSFFSKMVKLIFTLLSNFPLFTHLGTTFGTRKMYKNDEISKTKIRSAAANF